MHLLQISGGQIWPNFLPILSLKPTHVTFLTSADPKGSFKASIGKLVSALRDLGYTPEVDFINTATAIPTKMEALAAIKNFSPDYINLTGGTKVMSLAADTLARNNNITSFYVDTRRSSDSIEIIHQGTAQLPHTDFSNIIDRINVRIALKAQGFPVPDTFTSPPKNVLQFSLEAAQLRANPAANIAISNSIFELRSVFMDHKGRMLKKGALRSALQTPISTSKNPFFQQLLMAAARHGIVESLDDSTFLLTNLDPISENADTLRSVADHTFKLIEGTWFELALLNYLNSKSSFTDICWSVEPSDGSANAIGETDLVAFNASTLNLHFISCKTTGPYSPLDHIQGLRRRATKEGGSHAKAELWIFSPRSDEQRQNLSDQCNAQDVSLRIFTDEILS